ncbi:hypothetical protein BH09PSE4_BH09PSE4_10860 [soil metagenome]
MIALLALLLQTALAPPAPPAPPQAIKDARAYSANCLAKAEDGPTFPVSLRVEAWGQGREARVKSGAKDLVPEGAARSTGLKRYFEGRDPALREVLYPKENPDISMLVELDEGSSEGRFSSRSVKLNEPMHLLATAICKIDWK